MTQLHQLYKVHSNKLQSIFSEPSYQGIPIKEFKPVQKADIHYLHIDNDGLKTGLQPRKEAIRFWENILSEFPISKRDEL